MTEPDPRQQPDAATESLARIADSLVLILKALGISEQQLQSILSKSYAEVDFPDEQGDEGQSLSPKRRLFYGSILSTWRNDADFLDELAEPLPLPRAGHTPSLQSVFEKTLDAYPPDFSAISLDSTIQDLLIAGSIKEQDGLYQLLEHHFRFSTTTAISALNQLSYVADYTDTAAHNIRSPSEDRRFQRLVSAPSFPAKQVPVVKAMLLNHGMRLLEQLDAAVETQSRNAQSDEQTTHIAIGLYMSLNDIPTADG